MSDLQCPARLYVVWPAEAGRRAADGGDLPPDLVPAHERLAASYEDPDDLLGIADSHRGEAVLVRVSAAPAEVPWLAQGDGVALEVDGDGWRRV